MTGREAIRERALALMDALWRDLLGAPLQARGWAFGFDRARTRLGACHAHARRITISAPLAETLPAADVEDTIRHEIAHAVDVERRGRTGHDATWRALAVACGASPERLFRRALPADRDAPYVATCPTCRAAHALYREPATPRRCTVCARSGDAAALRIVHRPSGRVVWPGGDTPGAFGGRSGVEAGCSCCGAALRRARMPSRPVACGACCRRHTGGHFDPRFELTFRPARQPGTAPGG